MTVTLTPGQQHEATVFAPCLEQGAVQPRREPNRPLQAVPEPADPLRQAGCQLSRSLDDCSDSPLDQGASLKTDPSSRQILAGCHEIPCHVIRAGHQEHNVRLCYPDTLLGPLRDFRDGSSTARFDVTIWQPVVSDLQRANEIETQPGRVQEVVEW